MQADTIKRLRELLARTAPRPWNFVPWHVAEDSSEVRAAAGWLICSTSSDADAELIAAAITALPELLAIAEGAEADRAAAYDAGFMASGEGWNGEHGGDTDSRYYLAKRAEYFAAIDAALAGAVTQGES